ncbi:MAG: ABC transporter permease [Lysobacterales bacterium]
MAVRWTHYVNLVLFKARSDLLTETSRTYIGIAWWIIDPILYMAVFYLVFDVFMERGGPGFVPFLLVGLVFFRWFSNCVSSGALSIRQGNTLMQQVYLPKIIFPVVTFLTDSFKFACTFVLLLPFLWLSGYEPTIHYLALIPLMAFQIVLILACQLMAAAILPVLPDLRYLINHGMTVLLFTSGIFYRVSELPEELQRYLLANPMANLLTCYRDVLMDAKWPDLEGLLPALGGAAVLLLIAIGIIFKLDRRYPKIVRVRGA